MEPLKLKQIVEAALLAADEPLTVDQLAKLFRADEVDEETLKNDLREVLKLLTEEAENRGYELVRVASGYRYQVRQELSSWISRLWEEKPPRYTRALLETLALVAYKQPVTRGDIEQVRGVSVSQNIMRTLLERGWIRVVGQREVPGRPSMYGTTREFLDYFSLKSLDQLPPLAEIRELLEPLVVEEPEAPLEPGADTGVEADTTAVSADGDERGDSREAGAGAMMAADASDEPFEDGPEADTDLESDAFDAELAAALEQADAVSARFRAGETRSDVEVDTPSATDDDQDPGSPAQVVDVVTGLDGEEGPDAESTASDTDASDTDGSEPEQPRAKVVQLPTSSH